MVEGDSSVFFCPRAALGDDTGFCIAYFSSAALEGASQHLVGSMYTILRSGFLSMEMCDTMRYNHVFMPVSFSSRYLLSYVMMFIHFRDS